MAYHIVGFLQNFILINLVSESFKKSIRKWLPYDNIPSVKDWTSKFIFKVTVLNSVEPKHIELGKN